MTAPEVGGSGMIFGTGRRLLRPRQGEPPVFGFEPQPGRPPVGMLQIGGDDFPQGSPAPGRPHAHDFVALSYFDRGGGVLGVDAQRWTIESGDVFLIAPGQVVSFEPAPPATQSLAGWGVFFLPEALGPPTSGVSLSWRAHPLLFPFVGGVATAAQQLRVPPPDRRAWVSRMSGLWAELHSSDDGHREAVGAHLTLLLVAAARLVQATSGEARVSEDRLLERVFDLIERRYAEGISLADVARGVGMTSGSPHDRRARTDRTNRSGVDHRAAHGGGAAPAGADRPPRGRGGAAGRVR